MPLWARIIFAILFPLRFVAWKQGQILGWQFERDVWLIGGLEYSGSFFETMANARGEIYQITREGTKVVLRRLGKS